MKAGKAPGPSGIVVEMIRAVGDMGASMIRDLAAAIIRDGKVPSDWEQSFIVCLYKGKGDALERGNYHGLKLTEQVVKVLERIVDGLIRQVVSIDDSQFGFVPGRCTTDVGEGYSEEFEVKVGVHQGSVLSPLLFIIVLEALSREFRCGVPWEDLYADDLVIIAESLEKFVRRLLTWKEAMEEKGLRLNAGKTKIMICGTGLDLLQSSGEFPCAVCRTGVGSNSIFCKGCKHWVHKKCSGLKRLTEDPDYRCTRWKGTARPLDGRPQREVQVGPDKLEVVASFCYLGDMLSAAGGCELSTTTRVKTAWKQFKELKSVLSSRHLSFKTRGHVYSTCVRSTMLHASETWPETKPCLQRLQRNDRAMIRQICNVKPQDTATIRSIELLARLVIEDLDLILKERRLRWYGHVERSNSAVKTAFDIQVNGKRGPGRPKMTWEQLTERDRREWKVSAIDPHDRDTWRSGVRSAMRAASQLPGRGPTVVDMAPIPAH